MQPTMEECAIFEENNGKYISIMLKIKKAQLIIAIHASVWGTVFLLAYSVISNFFAPMVAAVHCVVNVLLVMVLFYSHTYLVNRFLEKKSYGLFALFSALIFFGIFILRISINLNLLVKPNYDMSKTLVSPMMRIATLVLLTSGFVWLFAIAFQLLTNRFRKEKENLTLMNVQQAAQLQYLKAQINPHFLFNALNNIYSLTVSKSDDAPKMLIKLSDLLRYAIYEGQRETIVLQKEVEHIHKFIELFQMKSEHPLPISFKTQGDFTHWAIEPMILIPLVENCFKHCDFETNEAAFIDINLTVDAQKLSFSTLNTFNQSDQQKDTEGGVGLENIKQRLAVRYHKDFSFNFKTKEEVFEVNLTIKTTKA